MKRYIVIAAVILGIILFAVVVKAVNDSYRINKTASSIINEQGSCRVVTNNSSVFDYFIPTKTLTEWNLFKTNKPADVSLSSCYQCSTSGTVYSDQTTCNSACIQTANCTQQTVSLNGTLVGVAGHPHYVSTNDGRFTFGAWGCGTNSQITFTSGGCSISGACLFLSGKDASSIIMTAISSNTIKVEAPYNQVCLEYDSDGNCIAIRVASTNWTLNNCTVSGSVQDSGGYGSYLLRGQDNQIVPNNNGSGALTFTSNSYSYSCPLTGGSSCSGSPQTCTAGQSCNLYNQ